MLKKYYSKYKEIVNYVIVGGMTTLVSLGSYYLMVITAFDPQNAIQLQAANIISWVAAVTFAYFTNRVFVFDSKNKNKVLEAASFVATRLMSLLLDMFFMFLFVTVIMINDKLAKIMVQFVVMLTNYLLSKFFVFRKRKE